MHTRSRLAALAVTFGLLAAPAHAIIAIDLGPDESDPSTVHSMFWGAGLSVVVPLAASDADDGSTALGMSALAPLAMPAGSVLFVTGVVLWPGERLLLTLKNEADGKEYQMVVPRSAVGDRDAVGLRIETSEVPEGKLLTLDQRVIGVAPNEAGVAALKRSAVK